MAADIRDVVDTVSGRRPADLLLRGGRVVNVFTGDVDEAHVAICGDRIASVGPQHGSALRQVDLGGAVLIPGLVDAHVHLESALLTPGEFARAAVPRGTASVVADPHEIANVLGTAGVRWMLEASRDLPLDVFLTAPSCVPATMLETAGAEMGPEAIAEMLAWERVIGLGEMMNVPGVVQGDPQVLAKLEAARAAGRPLVGHCPGLSEAALQAYAAAGISSDHESTALQEANEKLSLGMALMIREGSAARNLADLAPAVTDATWPNCMLVTDDRDAEDLLAEGHMDHVLRRAVACGIEPVRAVQMATITPARHFGLRGRGAIAPGFIADLTAVGDLRDFRARLVVKGGQVVARDGALTVDLPQAEIAAAGSSVRMAPLDRSALRLAAGGGDVRVIGLVRDQIVTRALCERPKTQRGEVLADAGRDLLKLAVIERHRATGHAGVGLVRGFGLRRGALASTVAHDSHNVIAVGADDEDMLCAVSELARMGGGLTVAAGGRALASLALPVAGLMSPRPAHRVAAALARLREAAGGLGCELENPFAALSFLALPVIPALRLTDRGLVDVSAMQHVPLAL